MTCFTTTQIFLTMKKQQRNQLNLLKLLEWQRGQPKKEDTIVLDAVKNGEL